MDPYKVLGLTQNASEDEVKHAYMRLAKKYHPDINQGNAEAEQRMKEINAAYDMIKNHGRASDQAGAGSYYGSYTSSQGSNDIPPEFTAARNYINSGYYNEAINVLMRMNTRSAVWYYYMAVANAGLGNRAAAMECIENAIAMDPSNYEYINFRDSLTYSSNMYRTYSGRNYPRSGAFSNPCFTIFAINLLLSFCTGGRALWFCL